MDCLSDLSCYIVDNNEIDLFVAQRIIKFKRLAGKITLFRSATEMLDTLYAEEKKPNYILLNFRMTPINGVEIVNRLSALDSWQSISESLFIITSSSSDISDLEKISKSEHVAAFLKKPIDFRRLTTLLRHSFLVSQDL